MSGQELEPGGPAPQLFINDEVLTVLGDQESPVGTQCLLKRGADAFLTVYCSPHLGHKPRVQRFFTFCTKTAKNKHRSSESS